MDLGLLGQHLLNRERRVLELPDFRKAAVLVLVCLEPLPCLVLTRRTEHLSSHAGQIAFAGGRIDGAETPVEAALREAQEEIGLEPSLVRVLGLLDDVWTPAGFHVTPVLGVIPNAVLYPNPAEVAEVLHVPLTDLLQLSITHEHKTLPSSARVPDFEPRERAVPHYNWRGTDIWGMTAFVIEGFLKLI